MEWLIVEGLSLVLLVALVIPVWTVRRHYQKDGSDGQGWWY